VRSIEPAIIDETYIDRYVTGSGLFALLFFLLIINITIVESEMKSKTNVEAY
jgi:hypothetical protein